VSGAEVAKRRFPPVDLATYREGEAMARHALLGAVLVGLSVVVGCGGGSETCPDPKPCPLTIEILKPVRGPGTDLTTVRGVFEIWVAAAFGVDRIQIKIYTADPFTGQPTWSETLSFDNSTGALLFSVQTAFDSTRVPNGQLEITAVAYDTEGHSRYFARAVNVSN
jgi:hypothetical protein